MKIALGIKNLRRLLTGAVGPTPVNTVAPTISGTLNQGDTLTATSTGTWTNTPTSYAYQWYSNATNSTVGGSPISGATASTFVINAGVGNQYIYCRVIASNTNGSNNANSNILGPAVAAIIAPTNSVAPAVTGTAQDGQTLTASTGTWANTPTGYAYQWFTNTTSSTSGGTATSGATSSTLLLDTAKVGLFVYCRVTASNTGGSNAAFSNITSAVASAPGVPSFPATVDAAILAPTLALSSAQTAYPIQFDIGGLGDAQTGDTIWLERRNSSLAVVDYFYHTLTDADMASISGGVISLSFPGLSAITTGTWRWYAYRQFGSARSGPSALVISGPDDIAPVISSPATPSSVTSGAMVVGATTDTPEGTLYAVLTLTNSAPTALQVENGQNAAGTSAFGGSVAVTSVGAKTVTVSGLSASTTYYIWYMHKDVAGNRSTVLSGGSQATAAAGSFAKLTIGASGSGTTEKSQFVSCLDGFTYTIPSGTGATNLDKSPDAPPTKFKVEHTIATATGGITYIGVTDSTQAVGPSIFTLPGNSGGGAGFCLQLGQGFSTVFVSMNGANSTSLTFPALATGHVVSLEVDTVAGTALVKHANGATITSVGTLTMTSQIPTNYRAFGGGKNTGDGGTANFGASAWAITPTAGYSGW